MKYSINSSGNIVAERDIYSLGGFIPKNSVGAKVANGDQISQDGECWVAGGDISARPDVRVKDNAYIGNFLGGVTDTHTDGITEFSGDTLIPGKIVVRTPIASPLNNFFVKDSFIGISMDVLCGQEADTTAFPFEQGGFNRDVPAGTLFTSASMHTDDANICRTTANLCLGKDTYLYIPTGYNCRVFWGYRNTAGQLAYSGESFAASQALTKLEHPTYKLAMVHITGVNGTAMTPTDLLATGAKILGHISDSLLQDFRPESASGQYVMDKSSFIMNTNNFGLATIQLRYLAGGLYNTNMYTKTDSTDYKIYGTFHNVQRLEYTKELPNSHRTAATRDTYISAYDCPLLRVDNDTFDNSLAGKGDLVLRSCTVPKARFAHDPINGNTYEGIDFSYANEDIGFAMPGYAVFHSSNKQGTYRVKAGVDITQGLVSHKGNLEASARLYPNLDSIPLDGSIMEQGGYVATVGTYYEDSKNTAATRVRTGKPLPTFGAAFPTPPAGFKVTLIAYLGEDFKIQPSQVNPITIETEYPYFVVVFGKADDSAINVTDFIALNHTLRMTDHTKAPEITGSAYVGAGCTVRGDVQLHGDPYVNRVFDVNMWERGTTQDGDLPNYPTWEDRKIPTGAGNRFRFVDAFEVEPGGTFSCAEGYLIDLYRFDGSGKWIGQAGWATSQYIPEGETRFAGLIIKKATNISDAGGLITEEDLALANVKYLRAFKKRRYITNELDRTSPEDILLSVDYWEQGTAGGGQAEAGKTYEELKVASGATVRLKRPINVSPTSSRSSVPGFLKHIRVLDAVTKFRLGEPMDSAEMALLAVIILKDPSDAITPSEIPNSRLVLEFVSQPRIIVPYGSSTLLISGHKIRMYDNAVLSRNISHDADIVLQGDAVMGYDFSSGDCLCSNGHDDAIIKLP